MRYRKYIVREEEYDMLVRAFPKLLEKYGMKMRAGLKHSRYAYCRNCRYYYTENLQELMRCPLCGRTLKHVTRAPKKTIDPEKYLGEVGD